MDETPPVKKTIDDEYEKGRGAYGEKDSQQSDETPHNPDDIGSALEQDTDDIKKQEEQGGYTSNFTGTKNPSRSTGWRGRLQSAQSFLVANKKKGPIGLVITIILLSMFGGVGFFGLALAPIAAVHTITNDLDDVTPTVSLRADKMHKNKLSAALDRVRNPASLGCGRVTGAVLPIKCRYNTMSKKMVERYKASGIEIIGEDIGGRINPTKIVYQGREYGPQEFWNEAHSRSSKFNASSLRHAVERSHNMQFLSLNGESFVKKTLLRFGIRSRGVTPLEGNHQDRVNKLLTRAGTDDIGNLKFTRQVVDGQETDLFVLEGDTSGQSFTSDQVSSLEKSIRNMKIATHPTTIRAMGALNIAGYIDLGCSIKNLIGKATLAAKIENKRQLAELFMKIAPMPGAYKAGELDYEDILFLLELFSKTDDRKTLAGLSGENAGSIEEVEITNPNYGKNMLDSELYKMSANGGVASLSITETNYSLGFGAGNLLKGASTLAQWGTKASDLGGVAKRFGGICGFVQSGIVRGIGIAAGIAIGILTGGTSATAQILAAAPMIIAFETLNWAVNAALSSNLITPEIYDSPVELGSAFWTGGAAIHSEHAMQRGMVPGNAQQLVAFQQKIDPIKKEYIAQQRREANPFDLKNEYSLMGSLVWSLYGNMPNSFSSSTVASLPTTISSFVFSGLTSIINPYSAKAQTLNPERFKQCDDQLYKDIGIEADVQCNVRFFMPEESLNLDPLEVAEFMEGTEEDGYVDLNTTTGMPRGYTPQDSATKQSTAKKFIMGLVDSIYNTRSYGSTEKAEKYGKFLDFCVNRTMPFGETYDDNENAINAPGEEWTSGKKCLDLEDRELQYFRAYVFDMAINDDLDESPIEGSLNCGPFGSGSGGAVGPKMSESELKQQITSYNMPEPSTGGNAGYDTLLERLQTDPNAGWAAQALLNGEKQWKAAGGDIKEYLTTAWIWFEVAGVDAAYWPDPYQMNCLDEGGTRAARVCESNASGGYQVAGYQVGDTFSRRKEVFEKLYTEDQLPTIMKAVVDNSEKASNDIWKYSDPSNSSMSQYFSGDFNGITLNDLWPNASFSDPKAHVQSVILGKDPAMVAALNSFAVSDHDVVAMLRDCTSLAWSNGPYYCNPQLRVVMSNMMMALYLFDGQGPAGANCADGPRATGTGLSSIVEGNTNPENNFLGEFGNGLYGYGTDYGLNGTGHTGIDIFGPRGTNVFTPVSGTVRCAKTDDIECFAFNSYKQNPGNPDACTTFTPLEQFRDGAGLIEIKLDNDDVLILGHMLTSDVQVGQRVTAGQKVGTIGCMNGHHVHVEYRRPDPSTPSGWRIVDPEQYLGR